MAEEFKVNESAAQIAYRLFKHIADVEQKGLEPNNDKGYEVADRDYILKTFAAAMKAVEGPNYYL